MRDIEEKILKSLEEDIKILKRANTKTNEIIDHIKILEIFLIIIQKNIKKK